MKTIKAKLLIRAVIAAFTLSMLGCTAQEPTPPAAVMLPQQPTVVAIQTPQPVPVSQPVQPLQTNNGSWSNEQLDALTAPIALYPDALLSQVLMASTYPNEVIEAVDWSKQNPSIGGDDAVRAVASQPWDPSVQSLLAFPSVLAMMGEKPDWVSQIGQAFLAHPDAVMDSVQRLRARARAAGNLTSTAEQTIIVQPSANSAQQTIIIEPANPQVVYVPTYNPTVVYGVWAYPAYPPVYLPPPPGYAFAAGMSAAIGFGVGIAIDHALWGNCDWNNRNVNINVNHYNHINVTHQITTIHSTTSWNRNINPRPIGNPSNHFGPGPVIINNNHTTWQHNTIERNNAINDAQRQHAQQVLGSRVGNTSLNGSATQRIQNMRGNNTTNTFSHHNVTSFTPRPTTQNNTFTHRPNNIGNNQQQRSLSESQRSSLQNAHPNIENHTGVEHTAPLLQKPGERRESFHGFSGRSLFSRG